MRRFQLKAIFRRVRSVRCSVDPCAVDLVAPRRPIRAAVSVRIHRDPTRPACQPLAGRETRANHRHRLSRPARHAGKPRHHPPAHHRIAALDRRHHLRRSACVSFPASSFFAAPVRSSPIPPRRESAFAPSVPLPPAARSSPKTMSRSTIRSAVGFTGRSSPSSPSNPSNSFAAAPATSMAPAPSAAWSTSFPCAPRRISPN